MRRSRQPRAARRTTARPAALLLLAAAFGAACNQTPTEITALPRAVGEIDAVWLQLSGLKPLDPATEGVYHLWAIGQRNRSNSLGAFFINASGQITDANGVPRTQFPANGFSLQNTRSLLITIEASADAPNSPAGTQILTGTFVDGVANLSVPISTNIRNAAGSVRIFTPTDGPDTNENSGFWFQDANGDPSLDLPDTTAALSYEVFVEVGGMTIPVGRFERPDTADDNNRFSSTAFPAPERPGEDLLVNPPEGLTFPLDLSGARITISLEGRFNDSPQRSQLIVLEVVLPAGVAGGEQIAMVNRTDSFPSGKALLY